MKTKPTIATAPTTEAPDAAAVDTFLRLPDVIRATGLSAGMIYKKIRGGEFPAPFKLTPKASGWRASEVRAWQDGLSRDAGAEAA